MAQRWLCKCDNKSNQIVSHCPLKGGEAGPEHVQHRPHTSSKAGQVSAAAVARILLILDLVVRKGRRGVVRDGKARMSFVSLGDSEKPAPTASTFDKKEELPHQ